MVDEVHNESNLRAGWNTNKSCRRTLKSNHELVESSNDVHVGRRCRRIAFGAAEWSKKPFIIVEPRWYVA